MLARAYGARRNMSKNRRFFHEASFSVDKIVVAKRDGMRNKVLFELDIIV